MKISEVRKILEKYSSDQLKVIVAELYKAMPKSVREDKEIDSLIRDPDSFKKAKRKGRRDKIPDIKALEAETNRFVENAYNQYYLIPNRIVPKSERSKWRFKVRRLYKDLTLAASEDGNMQLAAELLEKIYQVLCYSFDYVLFTAWDAFQSIGVSQKEFFRRILTLKYQFEEKDKFIRDALLLMTKNALNRYTLHFDLMFVILDFLKTPDMREMAIKMTEELLEKERTHRPPAKKEWSYDYGLKERINTLAEMGFFCYAELYDYDNAISFFKRHYRERDAEIRLYVLIELLFMLGQKEYIVQEYEEAIRKGIKPRDQLRELYAYIKKNNELPGGF